MSPEDLIEASRGGLSIHWGEVLDDYITCLAYCPAVGKLEGSLIAGSAAGTVYRLHPKTGETIWKSHHHQQGVLALACHPEQRVLASSAQDRRLLLLDFESGALMQELEVGQKGWCEGLAWSPSGQKLASITGKNLRLWDLAGNRLSSPEPFANTLSGLAWWAEDEVLVSTYAKVLAWKLSSSELSQAFEWPTSLIRLKAQPLKNLIAVSTQEGTVQFWRRDRNTMGHMTGYYAKVTALEFSPCGRWLASNGGPAITCWDFSGQGPEGRPPVMLEVHLDHVSALAFANCPAVRLASAGEDGLVAVWEQQGNGFRLLGCHPIGSQVDCLAWREDGEVLFVGGGEGQVAAVGIQATGTADQESRQSVEFLQNGLRVDMGRVVDDPDFAGACQFGVDDAVPGIDLGYHAPGAVWAMARDDLGQEFHQLSFLDFSATRSDFFGLVVYDNLFSD